MISLDMTETLKLLMVTPGIDAMFHSNHHSAEGNRATAEAIMNALARHHLLTQTVTR